VAGRDEGGDAAVAVGVELEDQRAEDLARGGDGDEGGDAPALVAIQARARGRLPRF
jgi:hypothetical protein